MEELKIAIDWEMVNAKYELRQLEFDKEHSDNRADKRFYEGQIKRLKEKMATLCYLRSLCD